MSLWNEFHPKYQQNYFQDFCPEIFCTFLGASWKLLGASCRLPYLWYYLLSPQEAPRKPPGSPQEATKNFRAEILPFEFNWPLDNRYLPKIGLWPLINSYTYMHTGNPKLYGFEQYGFYKGTVFIEWSLGSPSLLTCIRYVPKSMDFDTNLRIYMY